ncbi:hypothetical protein, partial [Treponema phagedenis]|uniref:hypothetical protein n=1 Tax=Treponema phagedenis TaxID=162 RepID=UPI001E65333E
AFYAPSFVFVFSLVNKFHVITEYGAESNMTAAIDILQLLFMKCKNCFLTMRDRFAVQVIAAQFLSRSLCRGTLTVAMQHCC